jgi:hypothetical protein
LVPTSPNGKRRALRRQRDALHRQEGRSRAAGQSGDIDRVLTTRELARMIRARGIAFNALPKTVSSTARSAQAPARHRSSVPRAA